MTVTDDALQRPFDALFNFRDLGGHRTRHGAVVRRGRVYRSDGMHRASTDDLSRIELLGITRLVDLRTTRECEEDGCFDAAHPTIDYHHVPLLESVRAVAGARSVTIEDGDDTPLLTSYRFMLRERREMLLAALDAVAGAPGPVVFHCTAGKDRTGVLAALMLSVVGVDEATVVDDYGRSREAMARLVEWYRANRRAGETEDTGTSLLDERASRLLGAEPDWMRVVLAEVREQHGSVRDYLLAVGATPDLLVRIERKLLG